MTAKCALCLALLEGRVLNVKNVFETIGLTNVAREVTRMVEEPFDVEVSRTPRTGKSRYGQGVSYVDYYLRKSPHNLPGIEKMKEYIREQLNSQPPAKTEKAAKELKRQQAALKF